MSYEKFMMDADFCGALHAYLEGCRSTTTSSPSTPLQEVGPGSHFFGRQHTLRNYETAFWDSPHGRQQPFEKWSDAGDRPRSAAATNKWKSTLADYEAPPLDGRSTRRCGTSSPAKKSSMPDMWY